MPRLTLSTLPAPRFCPAKVVIARLRLSTGRTLNPSIFKNAPNPAIASAPKPLTLDCTTAFEKDTTMFCIPAGRPIFMMRPAILPFILMLPGRTR